MSAAFSAIMMVVAFVYADVMVSMIDGSNTRRPPSAWPSGYTAAEKCDEFPPPHGAYPKAKDHEPIIAWCIAAESGHLSPVRVIHDRGPQNQKPMYVRFPQKRTNRQTSR